MSDRYIRSRVKDKGVPIKNLYPEEIEDFASNEIYSLGWRWEYIYPWLKSKKEAEEVVDMLISPVRDITKLKKPTEQKLINNFLKDHRVIITLTTSPVRLPKICATLATLDLTYVDRINVVLPKQYGPKKEQYKSIPAKVRNFPKVHIKRIAKDLGPITKMLPTIKSVRDPKSLVISIDDDVAYPMGMVNELIYQSVVKHKNTVLSMGTSMSFFSEVKNIRKLWPVMRQKKPFVNIVEGWSSILYLPNLVNTSCMIKLTELSKQCFLSDDFVISYALAVSGVKMALIDNKYAYDPHPYDYGAEQDALHAGRGLDNKPKKYEKHSDEINFEKYGACLEAIEQYVENVMEYNGEPDFCGLRSNKAVKSRIKSKSKLKKKK